MAYTISKTDGSILATIADGTINNTATNLTLIGKNFAGYGDFLNENLVKLLENFSGTTAPTSPIDGQLWWDRANKLLKVCNNPSGDNPKWKTISSMAAQPTAPSTDLLSNLAGDFWWDTSKNQLNVFNGNTFTLVGPAFTTGTGTSGTLAGNITDSQDGSHVAVNVYVENTHVAIISQAETYTPKPAIGGFTTVKPGFNLSSTIPGASYHGTASNASALENVAAANYARLDVPAVHTSTITVNNNSGVTIGANNNFSQTVVGNIVTLSNNINNANIEIKANVNGALTSVLTVNGSTGLITVAANATSNLGIATLGQLNSALMRDGSRSVTGNLLPQTSSINLGATGQTFGNVYANYFIGTSIQAQYADLAERFHSDAEYAPGTVVALGGAAEITAAAEELSESVFGVISTKAAYLMNAAAGSDATHPAVAVNGRVPVRVVGRINKGDRLVAAGNGLARAGARNEISSFNVIGRSLETKTTDGEGTILAIVKLNS